MCVYGCLVNSVGCANLCLGGVVLDVCVCVCGSAYDNCDFDFGCLFGFGDLAAVIVLFDLVVLVGGLFPAVGLWVWFVVWLLVVVWYFGDCCGLVLCLLMLAVCGVFCFCLCLRVGGLLIC